MQKLRTHLSFCDQFDLLGPFFTISFVCFFYRLCSSLWLHQKQSLKKWRISICQCSSQRQRGNWFVLSGFGAFWSEPSLLSDQLLLLFVLYLFSSLLYDLPLSLEPWFTICRAAVKRMAWQIESSEMLVDIAAWRLQLRSENVSWDYCWTAEKTCCAATFQFPSGSISGHYANELCDSVQATPAWEPLHYCFACLFCKFHKTIWPNISNVRTSLDYQAIIQEGLDVFDSSR